MTYPQPVVQINQPIYVPPQPTFAPNGVKNPDPHPHIGVFIRW